MTGNAIEVRRNNEMIWAQYRFGLIEQKIMLTILSQIKKHDTSLREYFISWKELKKNVPHVRTKARVTAAAEKLKARTIVMQRKDVVGVTDYFGLLSSWTFTPSGVVFYIDPMLKHHLLELTGKFTIYGLRYILALQSSFSVRIYEMLKSEMWKAEKNKTKFQMVDVAKADLLDYLAIEHDSYLRNNHTMFVKKFLEVVRADISTHTDISFSYKCKKEGRFYTRVVFRVWEDETRQKTVTEHEEKPEEYTGPFYMDYQGRTIEGFIIGQVVIFKGEPKETTLSLPEFARLDIAGKIRNQPEINKQMGE